jgi:hypothetical protein
MGREYPWTSNGRRGGGTSAARRSSNLQRLQQQRRGAVAPRPAELVEQLPARALRQALQRQRRAHPIAAHSFQLIAAARRDGYVRMQAEALELTMLTRAGAGRRGPGDGRGTPSTAPARVPFQDLRHVPSLLADHSLPLGSGCHGLERGPAANGSLSLWWRFARFGSGKFAPPSICEGGRKFDVPGALAGRGRGNDGAAQITRGCPSRGRGSHRSPLGFQPNVPLLLARIAPSWIGRPLPDAEAFGGWPAVVVPGNLRTAYAGLPLRAYDHQPGGRSPTTASPSCWPGVGVSAIRRRRKRMCSWPSGAPSRRCATGGSSLSPSPMPPS